VCRVDNTPELSAGGGLGDQVVCRGEHLPGLGQGVHAGRGRGDGPAGAVQQPDAGDPLEGQSLGMADWLSVAAIVTANAVSVADGGPARGPGRRGYRLAWRGR
jgi:hypothetical protein